MGLKDSIRKRLPRRFVEVARSARFVVLTRIRGFDIPAEPHFDPESLPYFKELFGAYEHGPHYLEYGSGGSTVLANAKARSLVSVETDRRFLRDVREAMGPERAPDGVRLLHVGIGLTGKWGAPLFSKPKPRRVRRWARYPAAPWEHFRDRGVQPDVVLVDGRFRVACVLESLLQLDEGSQSVILLDDYQSREAYRRVEDFADLVGMQGRMAVLRRKADMDKTACAQALSESLADHL